MSQRFQTADIVRDGIGEPLGVGVGVEIYSWYKEINSY